MIIDLGDAGLRLADTPVIEVRAGGETIFQAPWNEQRRNLFKNPAVVSKSGFAVPGGQGTLAYVGSAVRGTAASSSWCELRLDAAGVVSGAEYRLMVRARASKTLNVDLRIRAGASTAVTLGTEWAWAETTGAAGPGTTFQSGFSLRPTSGHSSGDWVEVDRVLLADGADMGDWYSGDTYDEPLRRTRWLGLANSSASVLEVIGSV